MIVIKNDSEIRAMRAAGHAAAAALAAAGARVAPGVTTREIEEAAAEALSRHGAEPTFFGYHGFAGKICVSVNEEVIHGIPGSRRIRAGDLVKLDVGATKDGFVGDCAATFPAGTVSEEARRLMEVTKRCFFAALPYARPGYRVSDLSAAVEACAVAAGYGVVRDFVGHGVGRKLHEEPEVPNFGRPGYGPRLLPGMTIAIEPMINAGGFAVRVLADGWTVVTADGSLSAHYEHSVLITRGEPELLTAGDDSDTKGE